MLSIVICVNFIRECYSVLPANCILTKSQIAYSIAGICTYYSHYNYALHCNLMILLCFDFSNVENKRYQILYCIVRIKIIIINLLTRFFTWEFITIISNIGFSSVFHSCMDWMSDPHLRCGQSVDRFLSRSWTTVLAVLLVVL